MATRPRFNKSDIASNVPTTRGNALTAELITQAFPESQQKRKFFDLYPLNKGAIANGAATELFIDGVQNYRFGIAERSTCMFKALVTYNNNVAGSNVAFEVTGAYQNVGGVVTAIAAPTVTKIGASTATFAVTIDAANQALIFTGTGVAGDANGRWAMGIFAVTEVTDLG